MSLFIPIWALIAIGGGIAWYMNNRWIAVGAWVIAAVWAGFVNIPVLNPVVTQIKQLVA